MNQIEQSFYQYLELLQNSFKELKSITRPWLFKLICWFAVAFLVTVSCEAMYGKVVMPIIYILILSLVSFGFWLLKGFKEYYHKFSSMEKKIKVDADNLKNQLIKMYGTKMDELSTSNSNVLLEQYLKKDITEFIQYLHEHPNSTAELKLLNILYYAENYKIHVNLDIKARNNHFNI